MWLFSRYWPRRAWRLLLRLRAVGEASRADRSANPVAFDVVRALLSAGESVELAGVGRVRLGRESVRSGWLELVGEGGAPVPGGAHTFVASVR